MEGLPAFAREEESAEEEDGTPDLEDPKEGKDLNPMLGEDGLGSDEDLDDLDEKSVASALSSISSSPEANMNPDLSGITNQMVTSEDVGDASQVGMHPAPKGQLSGVEKTLIGVSAFVFLGLLAGVLVFLVMD